MAQPYTQPSGGAATRASGGPRPPLDRYDFLFRALRNKAWQPLGQSDAQRRAHIRECSEALFAQDSVAGTLPAAYTFFGQFVTHDLAFDARTDLADSGTRIQNYRTPRFDLDSVYGAGPRRQPELYQIEDPRRLAVGRNEFGEPDLARSDEPSLDHPATRHVNRRRRALIGDPRNDESIVLAQLHLAFLRFHNRLVEEGHDFEEARRLTRLHYQWILLNEFLAALCTTDRITQIRQAPSSNRLFPRDRVAFVPFEFAFAAFRFGHSLVGPSYHLSDDLERERRGSALDFYVWHADDWPTRDAAAGDTLDGERALPGRWSVQWDRFLAGNTPGAQPAQRIDTRLSRPLRFLPLRVAQPEERQLAFRTLLRGWHIGLPSGQAVAAHIGETPLPPTGSNEDPLATYVLREAELASGAGGQLGPVCARIVAEVCVRLLEADPDSILNQQQRWSPALSSDGTFTLADLLRYARMPITSAEWQRYIVSGSAV